MISTKVAYWTIAIGLAVTVVSGILYLLNTTGIDPRQPLDVHVFESYGAFVGGLVGPAFALAGVLLLLTTLAEQKDAFLKQQIESRFFQLVSLARNNSERVSIKGQSGRRVFIVLIRELTESYRAVRKTGKVHRVDKKHFANIAYLAFFYGAIGGASAAVLRRRLEGKFPRAFIDDLLAEYSARAQECKASFRYAPFRGHQSRLGHYYRHLFQTVSYINRQPYDRLTYSEKYQYIKTLRAQLSTHEQVLFFLNSLSDIGLAWELDPAIHDPNDRLITKYNLIKNIPDGFSRYINPRRFYPLVAYEGLAAPPAGRAELERRYSQPS